jgi:hypothetical protein
MNIRTVRPFIKAVFTWRQKRCALGTSALLDNHMLKPKKDWERIKKENYDFGNYAAFGIIVGIPTLLYILGILCSTSLL